MLVGGDAKSESKRGATRVEQIQACRYIRSVTSNVNGSLTVPTLGGELLSTTLLEIGVGGYVHL